MRRRIKILVGTISFASSADFLSFAGRLTKVPCHGLIRKVTDKRIAIIPRYLCRKSIVPYKLQRYEVLYSSNKKVFYLGIFQCR